MGRNGIMDFGNLIRNHNAINKLYQLTFLVKVSLIENRSYLGTKGFDGLGDFIYLQTLIDLSL